MCSLEKSYVKRERQHILNKHEQAGLQALTSHLHQLCRILAVTAVMNRNLQFNVLLCTCMVLLTGRQPAHPHPSDAFHTETPSRCGIPYVLLTHWYSAVVHREQQCPTQSEPLLSLRRQIKASSLLICSAHMYRHHVYEPLWIGWCLCGAQVSVSQARSVQLPHSFSITCPGG